MKGFKRMERRDCTSYLPHKISAYTKNKPCAFISHCSLTKNANEEKFKYSSKVIKNSQKQQQ
jgi:hypothetical protein